MDRKAERIRAELAQVREYHRNLRGGLRFVSPATAGRLQRDVEGLERKIADLEAQYDAC